MNKVSILFQNIAVKTKIMTLASLAITGFIILFLMSFTATSSLENIDNSSSPILIVIAAFMVLVGIFAVIIVRTTVRPLKSLEEVLSLVAEGEYGVDIPNTARKDEIGSMARVVLVLRDNGKKQRELDAALEELEEETEREEEEKRAEQQALERKRAEEDAERVEKQAKHAEEIRELIAGFDQVIQTSIGELEQSATEMQGSASTMVDAADSAGLQAAAVSEASDQMDGNVATMAAAIEQFTLSISEANGQVQSATKLSEGAVVASDEGAASIEKLSDASRTIEDVVNLINDIAEQTNLLALNATIEAARAGDAGRGFAVVAGEVKNLATQTASATEDITKKITEMQTLSGGAVASMNSIRDAIAELNKTMLGISAAIEEQSAATGEISRNVQFTAEGTQRVTSEIGQVAANVEMTKNSSGDVMNASTQLESLAASIKEEVQSFLKDVQSV